MWFEYIFLNGMTYGYIFSGIRTSPNVSNIALWLSIGVYFVPLAVQAFSSMLAYTVIGLIDVTITSGVSLFSIVLDANFL